MTTTKSRRPTTKAPAAPPAPLPLLRTRFRPRHLLHHFHKLLPAALLAPWLADLGLTFYQRAFTPLLTLWYLVFQRLSEKHGLSQVVSDARDGGADHLSPRGKPPLSAQLRSEATTAFSDARQRLPLALRQHTLWPLAAQTAATLAAPMVFGLRVGLIDGSTCRLRPLGDIPQHFPPHRPGNCRKAPYWCVARVLGIFCHATGGSWTA